MMTTDVEEKAKEIVEKPTSEVFKETIIKINEVLLENPSCMGIRLVKEEEGHAYRWDDMSKSAKDTRRKVQKLLKEMWQKGVFNYRQIADALRVEVLSIKTLIEG